jgi:hypothetical protein
VEAGKEQGVHYGVQHTTSLEPVGSRGVVRVSTYTYIDTYLQGKLREAKLLLRNGHVPDKPGELRPRSFSVTCQQDSRSKKSGYLGGLVASSIPYPLVSFLVFYPDPL